MPPTWANFHIWTTAILWVTHPLHPGTFNFDDVAGALWQMFSDTDRTRKHDGQKMPQCQAYGCNNKQSKGDSKGRGFYKIPDGKLQEKRELAAQWLHKIDKILY